MTSGSTAFRLAIASGKGGTGKTTLALALAEAQAQIGPVTLCDCDVEEPNAHLFLTGRSGPPQAIHRAVPRIDAQRCDRCGRCVDLCAFNALAVGGDCTLVFDELCHSCGGCARVCPTGAIHEENSLIGHIRQLRRDNLLLISGTLAIGQVMAPPLIRAVLADAAAAPLVLVDCPPGTSCPMIAAVRSCDVVLLVTEPTPFGLNDLKLAVATVRLLGLPCAVVINRAGSGNDAAVHQYCQAEQVPVALEIPDDRRIAEGYSRGTTLLQTRPELAPALHRLLADSIRLGRNA